MRLAKNAERGEPLIENFNLEPRYEKGELEEEATDAYDTTIRRLRAFADLEFAKRLEKEEHSR
jgi:hypothetical protein